MRIHLLTRSFVPPAATRFLAIFLLCSAAAAVSAQSLPAASYSYPGGVTVSLGITNTQFPYYADNAAGGSVSLFAQSHFLLGSQLKLSSYPYAARFSQSPVTFGYRIGRHTFSADGFGLRHITPVGYFGAGFSKSHDTNRQYEPTPTEWNRCWEGSAGVDIPYEHLTVRLMDLSYVRTITPVRQIGTYNVSMGITFHPHLWKSRPQGAR